MRQWAFIVGLNDYQFFQPLSCAQRDAQALHQFLIQEAGFPAEQCLLLTNSSPEIWGKPTTPTRGNLLSWIELLASQCIKPGDTLWFFFSGYGVCSQGQDYLVPVDGDPNTVETTCLPLTSIYQYLAAPLASGTGLFLLDISRSQASLSHESVGIQTSQLAHQIGIPTILSCQPGQFSREISGLGLGLFTAALVEGLRYQQGATLATLIQFLRDRLPQLSEHYWQPTQSPLAIFPAERLHQPLLTLSVASASWERAGTNGHHPQSSTGTTATLLHPTTIPVAEVEIASDAAPTVLTDNGIESGHHWQTQFHQGTTTLPRPGMAGVNGGSGTPAIATTPLAGATAVTPATLTAVSQAANTVAYRDAIPTQTASAQPVAVAAINNPAPPAVPDVELADASLWKPILLWGGLTSLVLVSCVLWRNWSLLSPQASEISQNSAASIAPAPIPPTSQPTVSPSPTAVPPTGAAADGSTPLPPESAPSTGQILNFNPVPTPTPSPVGQTLLSNAREMVKSDQATPYRDAILEARKISSTDPVYQEAQQDIADWSQTIYAIAQRRANQQQWDIAIMAADLISPDDQKLHPQAQAALSQWCPAIRGNETDTYSMRKARAICATRQPL